MSRAWGEEGRGPGPAVTRDDLVRHIRSGFKEPEDWRLGLEQEKLVVRRDGTAAPYYGEGGVEEMLQALVSLTGLEPRREEGHIVGLESPGISGISLEPGGQVEFVSAPRRSLAELEEDLCSDLERVLEAAGEDRALLALGLQPVTGVRDMEWISRERYRIMARHMGARGRLAHRMMTQTAGVQLNVDFRDDEDLARKMRTAMGVTSLVTGAFANSPFSEGGPNGWLSYRSRIWTETDPDRCGLLPEAFLGDGLGPEAWVDYALDVPLMFFIREGRYRALDGRTFRQFMEEGYEGHHPDLSDWELHLTTLFPEVRAKTYMEVRGMDAVSRPLALAGMALWKGILYSTSATEEAWALVEDLDWEERLELHEEAARHGTRGNLRGRPLSAWVQDLVAVARRGLQDPERATPEEGEDAFLEPLEERLADGLGSPGFDLLERWEEEWNGDVRRLVEFTALDPCSL